MPDPTAVAHPPVGEAPGDLATLQAFVNTLDVEQAADELGSAADLVDWLRQADLLGPDGAELAGRRVHPRIRIQR